MGSKPRKNSPMSVPFYSHQAPMPIVVPNNPANGITLITGRPGAGQGYSQMSSFGLPPGDHTPASQKEQAEMREIIRRMKDRIKTPATRKLADISSVFHTPAATVGKLRLLRFYDRYVNLSGPMENMLGTGEIFLNSLHPLHDKRITADNIHGVSKVACAIHRSLPKTTARAIIFLAFTHWERADQLASIIEDRGITDDKVIARLLMEMGHHPEALAEGTL